MTIVNVVKSYFTMQQYQESETKDTVKANPKTNNAAQYAIFDE